jgi:hypothetical protein
LFPGRSIERLAIDNMPVSGKPAVPAARAAAGLGDSLFAGSGALVTLDAVSFGTDAADGGAGGVGKARGTAMRC